MSKRTAATVNTDWKSLRTPSTCSHIRQTSHMLIQAAAFTNPPLRLPAHTAGWPACRWPRLSHTLPSCLCGTWEPLWARASHTSTVNDTEAGCTKEVCPIKQRLSDRPPTTHTHTHTHSSSRHTHTRRHPGTQFCSVNRASRHTIWTDLTLLSANQAWETLTVRIGVVEIETES